VSPSRRLSGPTVDGVVASRPINVDVVLECREPGCDLFEGGTGARARNRLSAGARRHAAKTGHVVGILTTNIVEYQRETDPIVPRSTLRRLK
jgi:hypothetical protein